MLPNCRWLLVAGFLSLAPCGCHFVPTRTRDLEVPAAAFGEEEGVFGERDPALAAEQALAAAGEPPTSDRARTLEEHFRKGDYAEAIEMAEDLQDLADGGSEDMDVAGFIRGVSLYHLGRYAEAGEVLESHAAAFPGSRHAESAFFYRGSNLVRIQQWRAASVVLDRFLAKYPESLLMEYALLERAECHLAMGEYELALARCDAIERQFIYSKILDRALAMKGKVLEDRGDAAKAAKAYLDASEIARKHDHGRTLASCLAGLIRVSAEEGDHKKALVYYDTFFERFANAPEAAEAALAGLPALREKGRLEEGLERLELALIALPPDTPASNIAAILKSYALFYAEEHDAETLLRKFDNLSGRSGGSKRLHEQVVVARLAALEGNFPDRAAEIRVFYEEIRTHFTRKDLSVETLVKLGRHALLKDLADAESILVEALSRGDADYKDIATLELAKVRAAMPESDKQHLAIVGFREVLDLYGKPELAEEATLGLARVYTRRGDGTNARVFWRAYLSRPGWTNARQEAEEQLAATGDDPDSVPRHVATPSVPPEPPEPAAISSLLPAKGSLERGLFRASALAESGKRREAYGILQALLDGVDEDTAKALKGEEKRSYRKASLLHQDLGVELGIGAVEP